MNKKNFKKKNNKNKKIIEIVIVENKPQPFQYNKILYLIPLLFLLFNSGHLFMFAPLILIGYIWYTKSDGLIPENEKINKELINEQNEMMLLLPFFIILFILFFIFFYFLFSYLRTKTSLPCIQSCETIVNDISSNLDISSSVNI